jgi:hypothetical protein
MTKREWTIIGLLAAGVLFVFFVLCLVLAASMRNPNAEEESAVAITATPRPSNTPTITPSSTPTPIPLPYEEIVSTYNRLTELQRKDYLPTLIGRHVQWKARIREVTTDGTLNLDMGKGFFESLSYSIYLQRVPKELTITLQKDQTIEFQGVISKASDSLGVSIYIDFLSLAVATATPMPSATRFVTSAPQPTNTLVLRTATPTGLTYTEIKQMYQKFEDNQITSLQLQNYLDSLLNKKVHWKARIWDVQPGNAYFQDAEVSIDVGECLECKVKVLIPLSQAKAIKPDQTIEFDGQIVWYDISGIFSRGVSLNIQASSFKVY